MPQMSPIMWVTILISMNMMLTLMMTKMFFLTNLNSKVQSKISKENIIEWKW